MKQGNSSDGRLSKFFKVYLPGQSGDDLELPISFKSCLPKSLPKNVTVRSIYAKNWKLALRKCGGDIEKYVLVNGWKRIAKDEHLNGGDIFVFEYDGSRCFNFCIYEHRTTCKRLRRSSVQTNEIKTESDGEGEGEARSSDDVIVLDDDAVEAVDDDDVEAVDADEEEGDQRQYLDDAKNPSFTVTLSSKKKGQLLIPSPVIKDYGLNFPERITLVDPLENKFGRLEKKIKIHKNGSVFVNGFGTLVRRNKVTTTDKMVCELKKTGNNNLVHTIKVYVIRG